MSCSVKLGSHVEPKKNSGSGSASRLPEFQNLTGCTTWICHDCQSDGFFNGWRINGYYQYGTTDVDAAQIGGIRVDRIWLALDAVTDPATGNIVCNASLVPNSAYRDCKPLNLFGRGHASKEAIDWAAKIPGAQQGSVEVRPVMVFDEAGNLVEEATA